jgi:hypothetical protein
MDRRDLSIILIFVMLAFGGGLPQALHWKVDHDCCGSACAVAHVQQAASPPAPCCPHHDRQSEDQPHVAETELPSAASNVELAASANNEAGPFDISHEGEPLTSHDCSICQFLATLSAVVAVTLITPIAFDPIEWAVAIPIATAVETNRISSQGPRAPPRIA